jgi:hypothetical protein
MTNESHTVGLKKNSRQGFGQLQTACKAAGDGRQSEAPQQSIFERIGPTILLSKRKRHLKPVRAGQEDRSQHSSGSIAGIL